ncbi:hypothetical protein P9314_05120 [Paenibacillus validus]|uniref:hypothetical protein n=1 Tax=Paenibacillus validus TaxID=44253 RepID=UPI000FD71F37|nr:hypothetical protein [Paenibacillus validus]MED4600090.1 hypothetical protein [Paenibacillus validus]MED4605538.1 hypothetical protein [Paenibacillus validus]
MRNFIDSLFSPIIQFLDQCYAKLASVGTIAAKGIRLDHYFGFFSILGNEWTAVITSLITAFLFLYVLDNIQKISRVLLWFKALIKFW